MSNYCDPGEIAAFGYAINDDNPMYQDGRATPPTYAVVPAFEVFLSMATEMPAESTEGGRGAGHGEHELFIRRPIRAGETLSTTAEVASVVTSKAGMNVFTKLTSVAEDGETVIEQYWSTMYLGPTTGGDQGMAMPDHTFPEEARGRMVGTMVVRTTADQTFRYAGASGDRAIIHVNDKVGDLVSGGRGKFLQGMCSLGIASRPLVALAAGGDPNRVKRIAVRFARYIFPGQRSPSPCTTSAPRPRATTPTPSRSPPAVTSACGTVGSRSARHSDPGRRRRHDRSAPAPAMTAHALCHAPRWTSTCTWSSCSRVGLVVGPFGVDVGLPAAVRPWAGLPHVGVEDHVRDLQLAGVCLQPLGEHPPVPDRLRRDRAVQEVDRASFVVRGSGHVPRADATGHEAAARERAEDRRDGVPHLFGPRCQAHRQHRLTLDGGKLPGASECPGDVSAKGQRHGRGGGRLLGPCSSHGRRRVCLRGRRVLVSAGDVGQGHRERVRQGDRPAVDQQRAARSRVVRRCRAL